MVDTTIGIYTDQTTTLGKLCEANPFGEPDQGIIEFIEKWYSMRKGPFEEGIRKCASLVIGFYLKKPWTDGELAELVAREFKQKRTLFPRWKSSISLLEALGEPGRTQLETLRKEREFPYLVKYAEKV